MKKKDESMHQHNETNRAIDFIRENALALEIDSRAVITGRGEQFLHEAREASRRPSLGLTGDLR
jgi:hypothetical protein